MTSLMSDSQKKTERIELRSSKRWKDAVTKMAERLDMDLVSYIRMAVNERYERDVDRYGNPEKPEVPSDE